MPVNEQRRNAIIPNMTTGKMIGRLRALKNAVLADGKVDWNETEQLLAAIRPLSTRHKFVFEDYERLLVKCREDGKITPEESKQLALQLDFLCSLFANLRLKLWLAVAVLVLFVVSSFSVIHGITLSTNTGALRGQTFAPDAEQESPSSEGAFGQMPR